MSHVMFPSNRTLSLMVVLFLPSIAFAQPSQETKAADTGFRFDAFVAASPYAARFTINYNDCMYLPRDAEIFDMGVGGAVSYKLARHFELGIGLRYDLGIGQVHDAHFASIPILATLIGPLGAGRELQLSLGLGLAAGSTSCLESFLLGPSGEVATGYASPLGKGIDLLLQAGVRIEVLEVSGVIHTQTPFVRLGVRFH